MGISDIGSDILMATSKEIDISMLKFIAGIRKERKARAGIVHPVTDVFEVNRRFKAEHDRSEYLFHRDNCILGKLVQLFHGDCLF